RFDFAMSLDFLAIAEIPMGLLRAAERSSATAVELLRPLNAASPTVSRYKSWLFQALALRALAHVQLGQLARAVAPIAEARAFLEHIGPESSHDKNERKRLTNLERARARLLAERRRWPDAVPILEANARRLEARVSEQYEHLSWLRDLIETRGELIEAR